MYIFDEYIDDLQYPSSTEILFLPKHSAFSKQGKHSVEFYCKENNKAGQSTHF